MFGSDVLDILIGLALTYAVLGVICTGLTELVSTALSQRSKTLEKGIRNLLNEPGATAELTLDVYKHPLIKSLGILKMRGKFPGSGRSSRPASINPTITPKISRHMF